MKKSILAVLFAAAIVASAFSTLHASDLTALQGAWKGQVKSNPDHPCSFLVSKSNFEFHDEADTNVWYKGTFSLRQDTTPGQFIAVITDCPFPQYVGKTSKAIYRLHDGKLSITGNEPGNPSPPPAFDSPGAVRMEVGKK
jgi:uncharacterized protein (TIGR03067 family)